MFFIVAQSCRKCKGALLLFADDSCKICVEVRKKKSRPAPANRAAKGKLLKMIYQRFAVSLYRPS